MHDQPMETDVETVKAKLDAGDSFLLLDCRGEDEYSIAHLQSAVLIPMDELPQRLTELGDPQQPIIVYCHVGGRSLMVAEWLRSQGYAKAQSMAGGIEAWSLRIDPSVPRY